MKNEILDKLVKDGAIQGYEYDQLSSPDIPKDRQQLILKFNSGQSIKIGTYLSGSGMIISTKD